MDVVSPIADIARDLLQRVQMSGRQSPAANTVDEILRNLGAYFRPQGPGRQALRRCAKFRCGSRWDSGAGRRYLSGMPARIPRISFLPSPRGAPSS